MSQRELARIEIEKREKSASMSKAINILTRDDGDSDYEDEVGSNDSAKKPAGLKKYRSAQSELPPQTPQSRLAEAEAEAEEEEEMRDADHGRTRESKKFAQKSNIVVQQPWTTRADGGINSRIAGTGTRGDEIYYCGVIDILQKYNTHKHSETILKSLYLDTSTISSVDPDTYAKRFIKFLESHTD